MQTSFDFRSLKNELWRRANLDYFKSEFSRLAHEMTGELRKLDMDIHIAPQALARMKQLEKRFQMLLRALGDVQKQVDQEVTKLIDVIKKTREDAEKRLSRFGLRTPAKKAARPKTNSKASPKPSRKTGAKDAKRSSVTRRKKTH